MSDIRSCSLKDVFPISISGEWGREPLNGGNSLVLRAADFTKDCKLRQVIGAARNIPSDKLGIRILKDGDILIEKSGGSPDQPVGRVVYFNRGNERVIYTHSNFLQLLRVADGFDKKYSYYLMAFLYGIGLVYRYQQQTTGIINLKLEHYLKEKVRIPSSFLIQKHIQNILSITDETIEKTEALIEKYQHIKVGLMHDLFTRGIGKDGKLRPAREDAPELYMETKIGWVPRDWECTLLKAKSYPDMPHLRTGPFGSALKGEHWVTEGHPVITIGSLGEGEFIITELLYIGAVDVARLSDFKLKNGDVVFSRVADVGRSVAIEENQVGWIMSSNLMKISLDKNKVLPHYLQYQLAGNEVIKRQIHNKVNAGGRDVANSDILNRLIFGWPDINEQLAIVNSLKVIDNRMQSEKNSLDKLKKQKTGLMHDLLTGKIHVKSDDAEAAYV